MHRVREKADSVSDRDAMTETRVSRDPGVISVPRVQNEGQRTAKSAQTRRPLSHPNAFPGPPSVSRPRSVASETQDSPS